MNEHIVFNNNCKHSQIYKEHHTLGTTLNVVKTLHKNQSNRNIL